MKNFPIFKILLSGLILSFSSLFSIGQTAGINPKTSARTQNMGNGELAENLWYNYESQWENTLIQILTTNKTDFQQFLDYNQITFFKDRGKFFSGISQGVIISDNAGAFFDGLKAKYVSLYHLFQQVKASNPGAIDATIEALHSPPVNNSRAACNPSCDNIGFENGTLSAWTAYYGVNSSSSSTSTISSLTGGPCGSVTQAAGPDANTGSDYHVTLMTAGGSDPVAGAMIPLVSPLGGNCARIGDGPINGAGVGVLQQSYMVSASNPILTIQYAVVLENPGHSVSQQPYFKLEVLDQNGNPITGCGQYYVVSGNALTGFKGVWYPGNSDTVYCKPWTTAFVPLYNYIGQCVTVKVTAADCALGGHFGYGYLACTCSKLDLIASSTVFCNGQKSASITGPPGAAQYKWTTVGGCISGSSTLQTLKVTCGGTYKLITTSSAGASCVDTFSIIIPNSPSGPPPVPCFTANVVCSGTPTQFNATCSTPNSGGAKFYWDFYNTGNFQDSSGTSPTFVFNAGGTYKVRLHEMVGLCGADTIINVVVNPSTIAGMPTVTGVPTNASSCSACDGKVSINISGITNNGGKFTISNTFDTFVITMNNGAFSSTGSTGGCGTPGMPGSGNSTASIPLGCVCPGNYKIFIHAGQAGVSSPCNPGATDDTVSVTVNANGVNISSNQVTSAATCGKNNGSATVSGLGGASPYTYTWSNGLGTGPSKTGLSPGTYSVTIKDANGCAGNVTVKILAVAKLTALVIPYDVTCYGANNGGVKVNPLSGTAPFTYAWTPNVSVTDTAGGLAPGNYKITLTDAGGCTGTVIATVSQPSQLRDSIASSLNNIACGLKAYATVGVKGGTPAYSYKWSDGSIAKTDTMLVSGPYTVVVTDGNGCTANTSITIIINCGPTISATGGVICSGSCQTVTTTAVGGTTPYTYAWNTGAVTSTLNACPLTTTTYTVTVKDAGAKTATATATVTVNPNPVVSVPPATICASTSTPLTASGANTYSWSPATGLSATTGASVIATPAATTTYTVIGTTTATGCTGSTTVVVTINPNPTITVPPATICAGTSATLTAAGATTYTWSPATGLSATTGTSVTANPAATTTYTVIGTVTATGCTGSATVIVTVNPNAVVTVPVAAICAGTSATLTASGATTYIWAPATGLSATTGTSVTANPAATTTYTVTGTITATGCTGATTVIVTVNPNPVVSVPAATICAGAFTTLTASGATTYAWAPATGLSATAGASVTANPTTTTTYTVTGSFATGCTGVTTVIVTINPQPVVTVPPATICQGNATSLTASGANTYTWSPATGLNVTTGPTVNADPTVSTTYTVTGTTTATGCTGTTTVVVTVNPPCGPGVNATGVTVCNGVCGTVTSTATGGVPPYTYSWNTGATTAALTDCPAVTTTYTITVTDNSAPIGSATAIATITVNPNPVVTVPPATICAGASATLTASGATTYAWAPLTGLSSGAGTSVTANPSATTTYTVTGSNPTGCTGTTTVVVTVNPIPVVTIPNASICPGGSTILNASGATTYTWSPATGLSATTGTSVTASPAATTTYSVIGTSAGCTGSTTVTVAVGALVANAGPDVSICSGASTTLNATGGTIFTWTPATGLSNPAISNPVANPAVTTTYTVVVSDGFCSDDDVVIVTVDPPVLLNSKGIDVTCFGACNGQIIVIPSGGTTPYTYSWSSGCSTAACNTICAGPYTLVSTDAAGCSSSASVTVNQPAALTVMLTGQTNVSCFGVCDGTAAVSANGGTAPYTYSWTPSGGAAANASGLCAGTFVCTVTDFNGCTVKTSVTITQPTKVIVTSTNANICPNASVSLTANASGGTGVINFAWAPAGTLSSPNGTTVIASPSTTTTYVITATDGNGCTGGTSVTVTVQPIPVIAVPAATICENTSTKLSASGASTYSWSPATGLNPTTGAIVTANPITTTTYTIIGTSTFGCTGSSTVVVTVDPAPVVTATGGSGCPGVASTLTASGANTYSWSPATSLSAGTGASVIAKPAVTTSYIITGTSINGCTATAISTVAVHPNPKASFTTSPDVVNIFDPTIYFNDNSSGATKWLWNLGDIKNTVSTTENPSFTYPDTSGQYTVKLFVTSAFGCVDSATSVVYVHGIFTFFIPNTFTPNGDGINDGFMPKGTGIDETDYDLWVFDRWGNLIWHTRTWGEAWDGRANYGSDIAQIDTYVWKVHVREFDNHTVHNYIGHVNIVK